jgi:heptosyltransferase-2
MKIAVFLPNWIGDAVMATPTLRALRNHFPAPAQLVGVMRPTIAKVLEGTSWLDEQILYDPRSKDRQLGSWSVVRQLRRQQLDTVVLLTNSLRTGLLAWLSGARERVGYVRYGRGWSLTRKLYPPMEGRRLVPSPVLDYYLDLACALGCPPESAQMELATLAADEQAADRAWKKLRLPDGRQVVLLNSGGAYGAAKLWPSGYFAALARKIAIELDHAVLVLCGPQERELALEIVRGAAHPRVVSLADEPLGLGLSKACVRRSRLLVTTDSGPRHFAGAFDVPAITLFGPTHIAWSENHFERAVHLQRKLDCSPCQQRVCPLGHHRCMRDLSVDEVYRAVTAELQSRSVQAA